MIEYFINGVVATTLVFIGFVITGKPKKLTVKY